MPPGDATRPCADGYRGTFRGPELSSIGRTAWGDDVITLYEHPLSPYSQKCRIALAEKGVAFELKLPERFRLGRDQR